VHNMRHLTDLLHAADFSVARQRGGHTIYRRGTVTVSLPTHHREVSSRLVHRSRAISEVRA